MRTPLMDAVRGSSIEATQEAIAAGANVNEIDGGMTPLLIAVYRGDEDMVRLLLQNGADPNVRPDPSDTSHTALWHAEDDFGLTAVAEILKAYGAKK
jgi:ankyrin repeat protein